MGTQSNSRPVSITLGSSRRNTVRLHPNTIHATKVISTKMSQHGKYHRNEVISTTNHGRAKHTAAAPLPRPAPSPCVRTYILDGVQGPAPSHLCTSLVRAFRTQRTSHITSPHHFFGPKPCCTCLVLTERHTAHLITSPYHFSGQSHAASLFIKPNARYIRTSYHRITCSESESLAAPRYSPDHAVHI